jgi:hypothetical protein
MAKQIIFLLCALLMVCNAKRFEPRDLIDEAEKQLEELQKIVQGQILVAHGNIKSLETDFLTYSSNVLETGRIAIQQEAETINSELTTIKNLGDATDTDISSCLYDREDFLEQMPGDYIERMNECVRVIDEEALGILDSAKYIVDIAINKVHEHENQFRQCGGNLLCISPLLNEIQLDKIRLPQNIKTEVQAADGHLTILKLSIENCSDQNSSEYTTEAGSVIALIADCVDQMLE